MARACEKCGGPLPTAGMGRPRKRCATCSPPQRKPSGAERVTRIRADVVPESMSLTEAVEARLRDQALMSDPGGLVVLELARSIDAGGHSGASLASLAREFRSAYDAAFSGQVEDVAEDEPEWGVG